MHKKRTRLSLISFFSLLSFFFLYPRENKTCLPCDDQLLNSARAGQWREVINCLKCADVNARNHFGATSLILAAGEGHTDTVRILIDNGADVN